MTFLFKPAVDFIAFVAHKHKHPVIRKYGVCQQYFVGSSYAKKTLNLTELWFQIKLETGNGFWSRRRGNSEITVFQFLSKHYHAV